jgi:excinuclease ABC subunit C
VYSEKQRIVDDKKIDRDVLAVVAKGDDACGVVFKVRDGKVIGSRHMYMGRVEGVQEQILLEQFMQRLYIDQIDIPSEFMLSHPLPSSSPLPEWLSGEVGSTISVVVPKAGEKSKLVGLVRSNAQFWLDELEVQRLKRGEGVPHVVEMLQKDLRLATEPRRIECFDNSNIQGSDPVSSMVVFVDGKPKKSEYRKYKIRTVSGPDDFESMREVVGRRYKRVAEGNATRPDLIVIDGGKGQLSSAHQILEDLGLEDIPVVGLAKRLEEVFVPSEKEPILLPKTSASLKLLQRLRDEAHRFAITYHRKVRSKRILQTELDLIDGIGKKRAKELLEVFGSVQGVRFATHDQLTDVVGENVADSIKDYFAETEGQPREDTDEAAGK